MVPPALAASVRLAGTAPAQLPRQGRRLLHERRQALQPAPAVCPVMQPPPLLASPAPDWKLMMVQSQLAQQQLLLLLLLHVPGQHPGGQLHCPARLPGPVQTHLPVAAAAAQLQSLLPQQPAQAVQQPSQPPPPHLMPPTVQRMRPEVEPLPAAARQLLQITVTPQPGKPLTPVEQQPSG
jgi:hypothetical protein